MHDVIFVIAMLWLTALVAALIAYAVRTRRLVTRILALDTMALVLVAAMAAVAIEQEEPGYLDVALVLAMLAFVQTVAMVRLAEQREDL